MQTQQQLINVTVVHPLQIIVSREITQSVCTVTYPHAHTVGFIAGSLGGFMLLVLLVSCIIAPLAFRYMRMRKLVTAAQVFSNLI